MSSAGNIPFAGNDSITAGVLRSVNWAKTPLGPIETWPATLKTAVALVLDTPVIKVMLWGPELITFYNDAYMTFLGANPEHGIGRSYPQYRPHVWRVIQPYVEAGFAGKGEAVTQMRAVTRRTGDEDFGYFAISFTPVRDEDGAVVGVMGDLVETTAHVQLQIALQAENRRQRELFDQAPVFMALTGGAPDYIIQYTNRSFQKLVGGRDMIGIPTADGLPELESQGFLRLMGQAYETRAPVIGWDVPCKLENQPGGPLELHYIDFIYQPIADRDGKLTGILCTGSDVTDRHVAREKAEKLQRDLHHVSRMSAMGTMAATIAHELSQPLTAAGNYLAGGERAIDGLEGAGKEVAKQSLERARQQVGRAGEIIRRVRETAISDRAPHQTVSLEELIASSLELIEVTDGCKDIDVRIELAPDAVMVAIDPVQGEQVLLNLTRNACQAMAASERKELRIASSALADGYARITISDTGPGLPADDVFAAFARSTTGGLGLGLPLSRTLVESHGGAMWAHNNPEGGADFHFTLPMRAALDMGEVVPE
jgi:two-component system sensor kinase FixL